MKKAYAWTLALVALISGAAVAGLSLWGEPVRRLRFELSSLPHRPLSPTELADWIVEGRKDFTLVDLREPGGYSAGHIRGAVHCGGCHMDAASGQRDQQTDRFVDLSKKLVLYTQSGTEPVALPPLIAKNSRLYVLEGGYAAWKEQVLAPVSFGDELEVRQLRQKQRREALRAYFAGERVDSAKPAVLPVLPIRRKDAHTPSGAREGC